MPSVKGRLRCLGLAATAVTLAVASHAPSVQAQDKLKVGVVAFYTGAAAGPFGIPSRNAAELIVDAINSGTIPAPYNTKGAGGLAIEGVYVDEAGSTTKVVTEFRNMVQRQNVDAVVGYISSGSCLGIAPVAEELKTFTIFFDCGTPRIYEDGSYKYVFRTSATATMDSVGAAHYVAQKFPKADSYQGINQNYAWGQDSWGDFDLAMKKLMPQAKGAEPLWPKLFQGQYGAEISRLSVTPPKILHSSLWGGDLESFLLQASARSLQEKSVMVLTTGETVMFRLNKQLPDGVVLGGRGPYGVLAQDTPLNTWFREEYLKRFSTPPTYPSYQMAQAFLGLKIAYDNAAKTTGGKKPTSEQAGDGLRGKSYEAFGTKVEMALGKGQQAITETAYGVSKWDAAKGQQTIVDIVRYPAACVNPPEGMKSADWIKNGMPGAKC